MMWMAFNWDNQYFQMFLKIIALFLMKDYDNINSASKTLVETEEVINKKSLYPSELI